MKCTITEAKTKATAKLICVFVFAYANCWFSRVAAHIKIHVVTQLEMYSANLKKINTTC